MRQKFFRGALLGALALVFVSCDLAKAPDFGTGTLTLFLPETRGAAASRAVLPDSFTGTLLYRVTVTGPGGTRTLDLTGGGNTITLDAGTWTVDVAAYDPANPAVRVGSGSAVIVVAAGRDSSVRIPMTVDPAYEAALTEIYIHTEAELRRVGTDFAIDGSVKFYLERDIVLTQPWKAIGGVYPFAAEFDGQGHTVTVRAFDGPVLENNFVCQGFFAYTGSFTDGAVIKNITVRYELPGPADIRTGDPSRYNQAYAGGIAGKADNTAFQNIQVTGNFSVIANAAMGLTVGGIAGDCGNGTAITNCRVSGDVGGDSEGTLTLGGIGGSLNYGAQELSGSSFTGRIKGRADEFCETGGIAGLISDNVQIDECYAAGWIKGEGKGARVGGITGHSRGIIRNSYARAFVEAYTRGTESPAGAWGGGIAGDLDNATISACYALGTVKADANTGVAPNKYAGGIFGKATTAGTIEYCVALNEKIEAATATGGIGGEDTGGSSYTSNYAASDIVFISPPGENATGDLRGDKTHSRVHFEGQGKQGNYPSGWVFGAGGNWKYVSGYGYPVLSWQDRPPADPVSFPSF